MTYEPEQTFEIDPDLCVPVVRRRQIPVDLAPTSDPIPWFPLAILGAMGFVAVGVAVYFAAQILHDFQVQQEDSARVELARIKECLK